MKLLAIDTSTPICSICISDSNTIIGEYISRSSITHSERLMPAIDFVFSHLDWGIADLDGLAVINGPGSFTGLRISLSVVKGLAYALKLPVVTASALEVAASQILFPGYICAAMDARRGEIFTCLFERRENRLLAVTDPCSISPAKWKMQLPSKPILFCGPGADLYFSDLRNHEDSRLVFSDFILARTLAHLANEKFAQGDVLTGGEVKAAYLRPSDAESKGPRSPKQFAPVRE